MTLARISANGCMIAYFLLCVITLFWWAPHFLNANDHMPVLWTYRYVAASGIVFGFLVMTVIARQSVTPFFNFILLGQVLVCGLLLLLGLYTFYYLPQSNTFCALHLLFSGVLILWNFYQYRKAVSGVEEEDD